MKKILLNYCDLEVIDLITMARSISPNNSPVSLHTTGYDLSLSTSLSIKVSIFRLSKILSAPVSYTHLTLPTKRIV